MIDVPDHEPFQHLQEAVTGLPRPVFRAFRADRRGSGVSDAFLRGMADMVQAALQAAFGHVFLSEHFSSPGLILPQDERGNAKCSSFVKKRAGCSNTPRRQQA
jgi:hypothetical protein